MGRDSVADNISRCVSALNLETLENAYHSMRYKVDYYLIHARLKYYSNSKNPRVIHTKLNNEQLTSLRTCPFDPYVVRPGEFLTLHKPDYRQETLDTLLRLYESEGEEEISGNEEAEKEVTGEREEQGDESIRKLAIREPRESLGVVFDSDDDILDAYCSAPEDGRDMAQRKKTRIRRSVLKRNRWSKGSPLAELARHSTPDLTAVYRSRSHGSPRPDENRPLRFAISRPPANRSANRSTNWSRSGEPKVWQVVMNDISLSAARLSTGSEGTARSDYENVSGDLTGVRKRDCFADNLRQGRAKFHGNR